MSTLVAEPALVAARKRARGAQLRRFTRRNPTIVAGGIILGVVALLAILAPLFAGDAVTMRPAMRLRPPSAQDWLGTDHLGRDVFARMIYGAQVSLIVGLAVAAVSIVVGTFIGLMAGYFRKVDAVVMRLMDGLMAIPAILLAIALVALTRTSVSTVIIAITIPEVPRVVRLVRAVVLGVREAPYVEAAIAGGTPTWKILIRHIVPNTIAPLIVQATYICASAILIEAALSFLGAGTPPEIPTWGNMIASSRLFLASAPWTIFAPGIAARARGARRQSARRRPARPARPAPRAADVSPLLSVRELQTYFFTIDGVTRAVDGVSFDVFPGETLGIVGESGCGKSVTALSIMRLLPPRLARTVGGSVTFEQGATLVALDESAMRSLRGNRLAMIFQEPMTSLNPVLTVGHQIAESVRIHTGASASAARERAVEMLRLVKIPDAARRLDDYPHQFSGGMRQRVMIATALACNPTLLIADEPTTALDVTIQAQILDLMLELKGRTGAAVILITHNLGIVAETCARTIVMYAGRKIEEAATTELFDRPAHPYTRGLMASMPRFRGKDRKRRLAEIAGMVPSLREPIAGCAFAPRCAYAVARCQLESAGAASDRQQARTVACREAERVLGMVAA